MGLRRWTALGLLLVAACGPAAQATPTATVPVGPRATPGSVQATPTMAPASTAAPTPKPSVNPTGPTSTEPRRGGIVKPALRGDPPFWDPQTTQGGQLDVRKQQSLVFETLLSVEPVSPDKPCSLQTTPQLIDSWKWLNDTTLETHLRPGVKFHNKAPVNGRELTADDIVYSFTRYLDKGYRREVLGGALKRVEATDKNTVRFITSEPDPALADRMFATSYGTVVMPREAEDPSAGFDRPEKSYIGSGPFIFQEYRGGVSVSYAKNPDYWRKGQPYVDGLRYAIMPDQSTRLAALRSGVVDMITEGVPEPMAETLRRPGTGVTVQGCPVDTLWVLYVRNDRAPFNDVRVRRAISMAIDRQVIINNVHMGKAIPIAMAAPISDLYPTLDQLPQETRQWIEYNPEKARALMADAGFPKGFETTVIDTRQFGSPFNDMTETWIGMLQQIGIKANLQFREYGAFSREIQGNFDAMAGSKMAAQNPYEFYPQFDSKAGWGANRGHLVDPVIDDLLAQFRKAPSDQARRDVALKVATRIVDQAYVITMPAHMENAAFRTWIKGYSMKGQRDILVTSAWARSLWLDK